MKIYCSNFPLQGGIQPEFTAAVRCGGQRQISFYFSTALDEGVEKALLFKRP